MPRTLPCAAFEVRVAPIDAARPVRLAGARLLRIVAAVRADLADLTAHATIYLHFHLKPRFEQEVEAADAISGKG